MLPRVAVRQDIAPRRGDVLTAEADDGVDEVGVLGVVRGDVEQRGVAGVGDAFGLVASRSRGALSRSTTVTLNVSQRLGEYGRGLGLGAAAERDRSMLWVVWVSAWVTGVAYWRRPSRCERCRAVCVVCGCAYVDQTVSVRRRRLVTA